MNRFVLSASRCLIPAFVTACLLSGVQASAQEAAPIPSRQLVHKDGLLVFPNVRVEQSAVPVDSTGANAPGSAGLRAYRDQNGKLRNATSNELAIEALQTPPSNKASDATVSFTANGMRAVLGDSFMSNAVVQRDADGRRRMYCVPGDANEAAFLDQALLTGKDVRHDH
jgi:hypothetical protein